MCILSSVDAIKDPSVSRELAEGFSFVLLADAGYVRTTFGFPWAQSRAQKRRPAVPRFIQIETARIAGPTRWSDEGSVGRTVT
jgi:hypothetical protein